MKGLGVEERATAGVRRERRRMLALLLFEAADCLMALPTSEVERLASSTLALWGEEGWQSTIPLPELIDLDAHFGAPCRPGPLILWRRGAQTRVFRVSRVLEVLPCLVRNLIPMPARLRSTHGAGTFWAVGINKEELFLLLDPATLFTPSKAEAGSVNLR